MAASKGKMLTRTSLLAGTSLAAAALLGVFGAVTLTPTAAYAANECGDPTANGTAADTFQCTDATTFTSITYPTTSGNLTLQLQNDVTVTTGGIVVTPTGSNTVTISRINDSTAGAGDPQITSTSTVTGAIDVRRTAGFNGAINLNLGDTDAGDTPMAITGAVAGIYVSNAGTGATNLGTSNGTITATDGVGVRLGTVGTGALSFINGSTVSGSTGAVLFAEGVNATLTNNDSGRLLGAITFLNSGNATFNNSGVWVASGTMNMGAGTSTLTNQPSQVLSVGATTNITAGGRIIVDGTLGFTGLETFNNGGQIIFGLNEDYASSDGAANDRLVLTTNYNAVGQSAEVTALTGGNPRLVIDFLTGSANQTSCAAAITADCLDMRTFAVAGTEVTDIVLNPILGSGGQLAHRIVLVDAAGGSLAADDFLLSEDTVGYIEGDGGVQGLDTGALAYRLVVDPTADQVYLAAGPGSASALLSQVPGAVGSIWDLTASAIVDRQLELHEGQRGGAWLRGASGYLDDSRQIDTGLFTFDSGYDQETQAIVVGGDFGAEGWAAGVMAASVDSEINPDFAEEFYDLSGYALGAYGTWASGPIYIDALANYLTLDTSSTTSATDGEATSIGVRGEAGYRIDFGAVSLEPLAAVSWTSTEASGLTTADGFSVESDNVSSLLAGLGARLAGETEFADGLTARFSFTGRGWVPVSQDEATTTIEGASSSQAFVYDDNTDLVGDIAFTAGLAGWDGRLSLTASAGMKFKEDREAGQFLLGLRFRF